MQSADSLEKTLMLRKIEGMRGRGGQRIRWFDGITNSMDMSEQTPGDNESEGSLPCCSSESHRESDRTWQLNNRNNNTAAPG